MSPPPQVLIRFSLYWSWNVVLMRQPWILLNPSWMSWNQSTDNWYTHCFEFMCDPIRRAANVWEQPVPLPHQHTQDYDAYARVLAEEKVTLVELAAGSPKKYTPMWKAVASSGSTNQKSKKSRAGKCIIMLQWHLVPWITRIPFPLKALKTKLALSTVPSTMPGRVTPPSLFVT